MYAFQCDRSNKENSTFLVTSCSLKEIVIYSKDREIIISVELFDTTLFGKLEGFKGDSDYMLFLPLDLMPMCNLTL